MYPRNATSPPPIFATVVSATDGSPITSGVAAKYSAGGGSQAAGAGMCQYQGNGQWGYTPTQAEAAAAAFSIQFYHASAVGTGPTVCVVTNPIGDLAQQTTVEEIRSRSSSRAFGRLLARCPHSVNWACIQDPVSGTGNSGRTDAGSRWFLIHGHARRIRQTGEITSLKFYLVFKTGTSVLKFQVWREVRSNVFDLVGETRNLIGELTAGQVNTIAISPMAVREGDYLGYMVTVPTTSGYQFYLSSATGENTYLTDSDPGVSGVPWESKTLGANVVLRLQAFGRAPHVVGIGDSIMAGHTGHYSFIEGTDTTELAANITAAVAEAIGGTWQNMGVGSETTANIAARFTTDCVNLRPRVAILQGGGNDLGGGVSQSTFIANWTTMLDACKAAGIEPIVCKIQPWTNGTNQQMQTRDTWNAALATLAAGYPDAVVVDFGDYVGTFRVGGDAGNKWDIAAAYSAGDGVHFNGLGYARMAQAVLDALGKRSAVPQLAAGGTGGLALYDDVLGIGVALTAQEVRDALKLAASAGAPATGSIDKHLDDIQAKTALITAGGITIHSMVAGQRYIEIAKGYDHPASEGLALVFEDTGADWGDYSTATCTLIILDRSTGGEVVSINGTYAAGPPKTITFEPTVSETENLNTGHRAYGFQLFITPLGGESFLRAWGDVTVLSYWP